MLNFFNKIKRNYIVFLILLIVFGLSYYKKSDIINFFDLRYKEFIVNRELIDLASCINKDSVMTTMNIVKDEEQHELFIGITYDLPIVSDKQLANSQFSKSYRNLFLCSLKVNEWTDLFVVYFKITPIHTIDDKQDHYVAKGMFVAEYPRIEVLLLSENENTGRQMIMDTDANIVIFTDVASENIYFIAKNPIGNPSLAIIRHVKFMEKYSSGQ